MLLFFYREDWQTVASIKFFNYFLAYYYAGSRKEEITVFLNMILKVRGCVRRRSKEVLLMIIVTFLTLTQSGADQPNQRGGEVMVSVPAGVFRMGCNSSVDNQCYDDEKPYHKVYLDAFSIDKYEVTVEQYGACVKAGKCKEPYTDMSCNWGRPDRVDHPINCVNWYDAKAYCEWNGKRLPTEAEWEKASRGTDGRKYPWGNQEANCEYTVTNDGVNGCGKNSTWPVGGKPKDVSPYGAIDMAGNVAEWTADCYDSSFYTRSPERDPKGPTWGQTRVIRGGAWGLATRRLRASSRYSNPPGNKNPHVGFRCAK